MFGGTHRIKFIEYDLGFWLHSNQVIVAKWVAGWVYLGQPKPFTKMCKKIIFFNILSIIQTIAILKKNHPNNFLPIFFIKTIYFA
jgi:hypothetical protein